jgi:hypothetical protein
MLPSRVAQPNPRVKSGGPETFSQLKLHSTFRRDL